MKSHKPEKKYSPRFYLVLDGLLLVVLLTISIKYLNPKSNYLPANIYITILLFICIVIVFIIIYVIELFTNNILKSLKKYDFKIQRKISLNYDLFIVLLFTPILLIIVLIEIEQIISARFNIEFNQYIFFILIFGLVFGAIFLVSTKIEKRTFISISDLLLDNEKIIWSSNGTFYHSSHGRGAGTFFLTNLQIIYLPSPYTKFISQINETFIPFENILSISKLQDEKIVHLNKKASYFEVKWNRNEEWKKHLAKHTKIDLSQFVID